MSVEELAGLLREFSVADVGAEREVDKSEARSAVSRGGDSLPLVCFACSLEHKVQKCEDLKKLKELHKLGRDGLTARAPWLKTKPEQFVSSFADKALASVKDRIAELEAKEKDSSGGVHRSAVSKMRALWAREGVDPDFGE